MGHDRDDFEDILGILDHPGQASAAGQSQLGAAGRRHPGAGPGQPAVAPSQPDTRATRRRARTGQIGPSGVPRASAPGVRPTPVSRTASRMQRRAVDPAASTRHPRRLATPPAIRRRRYLLFAGAAVLILLAAFAIRAIFFKQDPTVKTPPTPTIASVPVGGDTALAKAIPTAVQQFALVKSQVVDTKWGSQDPAKEAGAFEGYRLEYKDGTQTIECEVLQFGTPADADKYTATLTKTAPADAQKGDIHASGVVTGKYTAWSTPETGYSVWTNGTVTVQLKGPAAALDAFRTSYSL